MVIDIRAERLKDEIGAWEAAQEIVSDPKDASNISEHIENFKTSLRRIQNEQP